MTRHRLRTLFLIILAIGNLAAGLPRSGRLVFRDYGPTEGLEHTSLTTLAQDAAGFLWAGTEGGAYRFDGTGFRLWSLPEGLPSAWVRAFGPVEDGSLWIGTRAGLCHFQGGQIRRLEPTDPLASARINQILSDAKGQVWVAADSGLFRSIGRGLRFAPVPGWPGGPAYALALGPEGLWIGGPASLHHRGGSGQWQAWSAREGLASGPVKALLTTPSGALWLRTPSDLQVLRPGNARPQAPARSLPSLAISFYEESLAPDGAGGVLIPTAKGLLQVTESGSWMRFDESRGLPAGWANQALVDRSGNLWVASLGLHRLLGNGSWENITRLDGLPGDTIWGLLRDGKGVLWIGTSGGLARIDAKGPAAFPAGRGLVLYALKEAPDGAIWGAGEHPFLIRISPDRTRTTRLPLPRTHGLAIPVALAFDRAGSLWVATADAGLWRVEDPSGRAEFHRADLPGSGDLGQVTALHQDPEGRLWAATGRGLARLDQAGWQIWGQDIGLRPAPLWAMTAMADGSAWIAYLEPMGLTHVNLRGEAPRVMEQRTRRDGLASDSVYSLASDAAGRLWVGGPRGVQRLEGSHYRLFRREDGLAGTDCNPFSTWVDTDDRVWFGTTAGLIGHRPEAAQAAPAPPEALLVSATLGSHHWDQPTTGRAELGAVTFADRTLSARFSSLSFSHEGRLRYQVRLAGLEQDWVDLASPEVRFPALPPGPYRLDVRAVLEGGDPGPVTSLGFRVLPPWWRRWWAFALWSLLAVGAGYLALRWRVRRLRQRNEELKVLVRQRTQALELSNLALTTISTTDHLTGLRNRRYLAEELPAVMALALRAHRNHAGEIHPTEACLVFAMLDLDHFKRVNDTWSHTAGDRVLRQVTDTLRHEARGSDFLIRWGGEEILFVGHVQDLDGAAAAVARLHQAIGNHPFDLGLTAPVSLTCSIGFSVFPFQPDHLEASSWEDQVRVADRCLYATKRSGRDGWMGVVGRAGSESGLAHRFDQAPTLCFQADAIELRSSQRPGTVDWD